MSAGASARVSRSPRQADESAAVSPDSAASASASPPASAAAISEPRPVRLPAGLSAVLGVLSSSAVVVDSNDRVLQASEAARAFGLVKDNDLAVGELLALARQ
jgi:two-component system sensor histidine kinase SenX3